MWKNMIPVCKRGPYRHQRGTCHFTRRSSYDEFSLHANFKILAI